MYSGILNVATGNYQLVQPICGWSGIGGGLSLSLYINSQSSRTETPLGSKWSHSFSLRIIGTGPAIVVDGDGTETKFTLSGGNYVAPAGIYDRLVRNGDNTWTLTKKGGYGVYRFNAGGVLTTITDNNNNVTTCAYSGGLLSSVTDPTNRAVTFGYTSGKLTSITDFESRVWTLTYTGAQLTQVSAPVLAGVTYRTAFAYTSGNVTGVTNRLNKTWTFLYGTVNDLTRMTDPDGKIWNYSITSPGGGGSQQTNIIIPPDTWPSDVVAVGGATDPTNLLVQYGFDSAGRVSAIRGATDNRAVHTYDSANNRLSLQTDSGATWNWSYDTQGNALQSSDPMNKISQITYDTASRPLTVKDPLNNTTSFQYDTAGNQTQVTDSLGNVTTNAYNTLGMATQVTDPRGKITQFLYDIYGNQTRITDPLGNQTNFQFKNGNTERVARRTDALGRITDYDYDAWGRQTGIRYITTSAPSLLSTYDAEGRLTQSTDSTGTRTYAYDSWGRRNSMTDPMGNTQATYDNAGRLKTQTDVAGRTHTYAYDSYQRLASVNDGSQTVQYTYTPDNRIATATYPNGTRADYGYNAAGRIVSITHKRVSDSSLIVGYTATHDDVGRTVAVTEQPGGAITSYQYDNAGRLLREERTGNRVYLSSYTYDAKGNRLTALRSENAVVSHSGTYSYDDASRLLQVVDAATSTTEAYSWNNDGTLASYPGPGYRRQLSYNEEGQLTTMRRDYGSGNIQLTDEYGYGGDGEKRWHKDHSANAWVWFPCGVACSAGSLVEKQSDLSGNVWTVSATSLRAKKTLVSRNGIVFHESFTNEGAYATDTNRNIVSTIDVDAYGVVRSAPMGTTSQTMYGQVQQPDEGLLFIGGICYMPERGVIAQRPVIAPNQVNKHPKKGKKTPDECRDDSTDCNNRCYDLAAMWALIIGAVLAAGLAICAILPLPIPWKIACIAAVLVAVFILIALAFAQVSQCRADCSRAKNQCLHS